MKTVELVRQYASLRSLIRQVGHDPTTRALEMQSHWARYVCVLSAGFVENIVRHSYGAFVRKNSYSEQVIRYASKQLDEVQNPKAERLVKIARTFDPQWGQDLEIFVGQNYRGESVNSIMSNRHLIAHGRNSNITVGQVSQYLTKIEEIADFIEAQCSL